MTLKIKELGYTLAPGERFIDESDCVDDEDPPELEDFTKSEINLQNELLSKAKEIELRPAKGDRKVPWVERLTVVGDSLCDETLELDQSAKIEEHFKQLASSFVKTALRKLSELKVPFNRPSDFYAEMMKSDEHMGRVMRSLESRQDRLSARRDGPRRGKGAPGRLSRRVVELQEKNKFIKSVDQLRKRGRGAHDVERRLDKLIANSDEARSRRIKEIKRVKLTGKKRAHKRDKPKGGKPAGRSGKASKGGIKVSNKSPAKGAKKSRANAGKTTFNPGKGAKKKVSRPGKAGKGSSKSRPRGAKR